LSKGESIRAIVPSDFAFGALGNHIIPGYMPIIIELELLDYIL
jgi:FKBP-type peptidyl-prolyl cis-trans isomerase